MKIASSGDWHLGAKNGSEQHCKDVVDFVHWMLEECEKREVSTFVHTGDFFDKRDKVDVLSLNYGLALINTLADFFPEVYMLKGNHDIMKKDTRFPSSLQVFESRVNLIEDYEQIGNDVMLTSWVCSGEEYDEIVKVSKKAKVKYMFGHFEFSNFKMNEHYVMEHGQTHKSLKHIKQIITGHYHSRQEKDNVLYNGAPFPMNYSNSNEDDLGFSILDTETGEVEFVVYNKIKILSMTAKEALGADFETMDDSTSIRVVIDEEMSDDDLASLQEKLSDAGIRDSKMVYKINKTNLVLEEDTDLGEIVSIDQAVVDHLTKMTDVESIDKELLVGIYKEAMQKDDSE